MTKTSTWDRSTWGRSTWDWSTWNFSTWDWSTWHRSTWDHSTWHRSTWDHSTWHYSTWDCSTWDWSTWHRSTWNWSISNYSTGHFSTIDYSWFSVFNKPCIFEEWYNAKKPSWLYFDLTQWIEESNMTNKEKEDNPNYKTTGWYLKVFDYKKAWRNAYEKATPEERMKVKQLPNFDADIFEKISGIRIDEKVDYKWTIIKVTMPDGTEYEASII